MSRHVPLILVVVVGGVAAWWFVTHVVPPGARRPGARVAVLRAEDMKRQDPSVPQARLPAPERSILPSPSLLLFEQEDMGGPPSDATLVDLPPATRDSSGQDGPPADDGVHSGPPSVGTEEQGPPQDE